MVWQGHSWVSMICQPQDLWLTDCWVALCRGGCCSVPSMCKSPPWRPFPRHLSWKVVLQQLSQKRPVPCQGHLSWMSIRAESQRFASPSSKLQRRQQFDYCIPRKTCRLALQGVTSLGGRGKVKCKSVQGFKTQKSSPSRLLLFCGMAVLARAYFSVPRVALLFSAAWPHCISAGISLWWNLVSFPFTAAEDHISDPLRNRVSWTLENACVLFGDAIDLQGSISGSSIHALVFSHACCRPSEGQVLSWELGTNCGMFPQFFRIEVFMWAFLRVCMDPMLLRVK